MLEVHADEAARRHRDAAIQGITDAARAIGILPSSPPPGLESLPPPRELRPEPARHLALVDVGHGALEWRDAVPDSRLVAGRQTLKELAAGPAPLVTLPVERLGLNAITERLERWDSRFTQDQGLRRWIAESGRFETVRGVPEVRRAGERPGGILLLIHGTFGQGEPIFDQLQSAGERSGFLSWAASRYEHVLVFNHPTLSVSPVLNALDLARLFATIEAPVDVIAHSRGGLVARWWLEGFGGAKVGPRRAVFVASPLGGTSLASPPRLREAMNLFATIGAHLKGAGQAASVFAPYLTFATALAEVFVMATGTMAATALSDLFFSAIPGLGSMSRVGNQPELERLLHGAQALPPYFAVRSDFQMEHAGWRFWRYFSRQGLSQWGADRIFDQPNDLVIDNRAAIEIFRDKGLARDRVKHFETNGRVHHTNYFAQPEVAEALMTFLA